MTLKRREEVYVPCTSLMADGMFRGALMGTIWGAVTDLDFLESIISKPRPDSSRFIRRINAIGRSAGGFALFIAAYSGGACIGEKVTGLPRDHYVNSMVGGFIGGVVFSIRSKSLISTIGIGSTTGLFAGFIRYLNDN